MSLAQGHVHLLRKKMPLLMCPARHENSKEAPKRNCKSNCPPKFTTSSHSPLPFPSGARQEESSTSPVSLRTIGPSGPSPIQKANTATALSRDTTVTFLLTHSPEFFPPKKQGHQIPPPRRTGVWIADSLRGGINC